MNYLKPTLPLVAGLVVFGCSYAAAQSPAASEDSAANFRSILTRPVSIATPSDAEVGKLESVVVVGPTESPFVSIVADKPTPPKRSSKPTGYVKPRLDLNPSDSKPDFGNTRKLEPRELSRVDIKLPRDGRKNERGSIDDLLRKSVRYQKEESSGRSAPQLATVHQRTPAPSATLKFVRDEVTQIAESTNTPLPTTVLPNAIPDVERRQSDIPSADLELATATNPSRTDSKPTALQRKDAGPARLNLSVLSERVESHNYSVTTLEQQLDERQSWDRFSLRLAIDTVRQIQEDQGFWSLYWDILDDAKRDRIGDVTSLDGVYEKLQQRIFEAQVEVDLESKSASEAKRSKAVLQEMEEVVAAWKDE